MSEFAVCHNGGGAGVSLDRLRTLLKGWLSKLVDNIILVLSFSFLLSSLTPVPIISLFRNVAL